MSLLSEKDKVEQVPKKLVETTNNDASGTVELLGARPLNYTCEQCGFQESTFMALIKHRKQHQASIESYKCEECDKHFFNKKDLTDHKEDHWNIINLKCDVCSFKARTNKALESHKKLKHHVYRCSNCEFEANNMTEIKNHKWATHEKTFECETCKDIFSNTGDLRDHQKKEHGVQNHARNL